MNAKIFKSEEGRARLEGWFQRFLKRVDAPVTHREVKTSIGPSHVTLTGDETKPPLVLLHGSLASSAHVLGEMGPLVKRFRIIAPDLPGQSVRGPQTRLPLKDDSLGRWVLEVIDGLGIKDFNLFGVSWGGFVARQTALRAPQRVRKLVLMVPAGIVTGRVWAGITRIAIPIFLYRLSPSESRLRRFVEPLFSTWDEDWAHYMGDAFRDFDLDLRVPPVATDEQLRGLTMPTLVFAAGEDLSFPGEKLIDRIKTLVPHVEVEFIPQSKHSPPTTDEFHQWMADRVTKFLESERAVATSSTSQR